jgi:hypothetical protein
VDNVEQPSAASSLALEVGSRSAGQWTMGSSAEPLLHLHCRSGPSSRRSKVGLKPPQRGRPQAATARSASSRHSEVGLKPPQRGRPQAATARSASSRRSKVGLKPPPRGRPQAAAKRSTASRRSEVGRKPPQQGRPQAAAARSASSRRQNSFLAKTFFGKSYIFEISMKRRIFVYPIGHI